MIVESPETNTAVTPQFSLEMKQKEQLTQKGIQELDCCCHECQELQSRQQGTN